MPLPRLKNRSSSKSLRLKGLGRPRSRASWGDSSSREASKPSIRMSSKATSKSELKQHLAAQTETQQVITIEAQTENLYSHTVGLQTEYIRTSNNITRQYEKKPTRFIIVEQQSQQQPKEQGRNIEGTTNNDNYLHANNGNAPPPSLNRYPVRKFAGIYSGSKASGSGYAAVPKKSIEGSLRNVVMVPTLASITTGKPRRISSKKLTGKRSKSRQGKRSTLKILCEEMSSQFPRQQPESNMLKRVNASVTTEERYIKPRPRPPQATWLPGSYLHAVPAMPNVINDRENKKISVNANTGQLSYHPMNAVRDNERVSGQPNTTAEATGTGMGIIPASFWHPALAPRVAPTMAPDLSPSNPAPAFLNNNRSTLEQENTNQQKPNATVDSLNQVSPGLAMALALGLAGPRWGELSRTAANFKNNHWNDRQDFNANPFDMTKESAASGKALNSENSQRNPPPVTHRRLRHRKPTKEYLYWNPPDGYVNFEKRETVQDFVDQVASRKKSTKENIFSFPSNKKSNIARNSVGIRTT